MIIVTFLLVLLPAMILTYLLGLIPPLRRNPRVYGIVALFVVIAAVALAALNKFEYLLYRGLAGLLVLGVLAADYDRTVVRGGAADAAAAPSRSAH
jgi:hypothetical protein